MRSRKASNALFLQRTESEWQALGVPVRFYSVFMLFPFLGHARLVREGAVTAEEWVLIRGVAEGTATHPHLDVRMARILLTKAVDNEEKGSEKRD
jgi:hypothetical protein